jgi:hypothetical protein
MASPSIRGIGTPVAGGAVTSPVSTAIGDLVVVFTFERLGAAAGSSLTIDSGNSYVEVVNLFVNDGSNDDAFGVGYKVATVDGAQSYQAFTSATGTPNWATGCIVLQTGTYTVTDLSSATTSDTTNVPPNPPSVTLTNGLTHDWLILAISAWRMTAADCTPTVAPNYENLTHMAGSDDIELAIMTRALSAVSSENPGAFGDDVSGVVNTASATIGIAGAAVEHTILPTMMQHYYT